MFNLIKNNLEIFIAFILIILIAGGIIGGNKIPKLWESESVEFNEIKLIELMKDRPEGQREIFRQKINYAKDLLKENPEDPASFEIMGFLHDTLGDKETAKKYYKKVLSLDSKSVPALNNLANIYSEEKRFGDAEELYLKITEAEPSSIEAWRDLHDLYRYSYKGKEEKADDILLLGLEKNPGDPQILAMLATYFQDIGDKEKAIQYYEQLLIVMPENGPARNELDKLMGD